MAAENFRALGVETEGAVASMRPRRMAAENSAPSASRPRARSLQ